MCGKDMQRFLQASECTYLDSSALLYSNEKLLHSSQVLGSKRITCRGWNTMLMSSLGMFACLCTGAYRHNMDCGMPTYSCCCMLLVHPAGVSFVLQFYRLGPCPPCNVIL